MRTKKLASILGMLGALTGLSTVAADVIHVPGDYPTIQQGIDAAVDGDEVIIADGVYTGAENRNIDFLGKLITVRSENGPENCIVDVQGVSGSRGFQFVSGETREAVLEGITITRGHATVWLEGGGAILILSASPTLINCVFLDNEHIVLELDGEGGAIYSTGDPLIIDCVFEDNLAVGYCQGAGGGFRNKDGRPVLIGCSFIGNLADGDKAICGSVGGGLRSSGGSVLLIDCQFTGNTAGAVNGDGGGASINGGTLINCVFENNHADDGDGGGLDKTGAVTVFNSLFVGNSAEVGGGAGGGANFINCTFSENAATVTGGATAGGGALTNCIVWNNSNSQIVGNATVSYSDVEGGYAGEGNISGDPRFEDPDNGDYRLKPVSPCIDAGDNTIAGCLLSDLDGNERRFDHPSTRDTGLGRAPIVDMGAYEFGSSPAAGVEDCNQNMLDDTCETAIGYTPDCNGNGFPDECDIADGFSSDCNVNGVPDECEPFADCNRNGVFDACDIADGTSGDCNGNGRPDECDIAVGFSEDCNGNGIPDECEVDCNRNDVPDECDIADGFSEDCDGDGVPDECQPDDDCDGDGIPDGCAPFDDCNANDIPDACEVDCNRNGVPDDCDIADGTSTDCNENGIPDECEFRDCGEALWDQADFDEGIGSWVDQEFDDFPTFASYLVVDIDTGTDGWVVSSVTTYFTNENDWANAGPTQGRLNIYPKTADLPDNGADNPHFGQEVDITIISHGATLSITAADLNIELAPGEYWVGLAPIANFGVFDQEHHRGAPIVGVDTAFRNPGEAFRLGPDWQTTAGLGPDWIGAFDAAISIDGKIVGGGGCTWDLDGDGIVGTGDLILLLGAWGDPYGTADLIELLGAWGECP